MKIDVKLNGMKINQPLVGAEKIEKPAPAVWEQKPVKLGPGMLIIPNAR